MQQLTIFCSKDLEEQVVETLDRLGLEGFLHLGDAVGSKFNRPGRLPRTFTWEASVFVIPAEAPEKIDAVVSELESFADACDTQPCLRLVVSSVDRVY